MAPVVLLSSFLLCLVPVQSVTYRLKGQHVLLYPSVTERPDSILWKHNGNKVVETSAAGEKIYSSHEGRVILKLNNAQLLISDLRFEDSGEYELEIFTGGKWEQLPAMELKVLELVAKPFISCHMNNNSSSSSSSSKVSAVLHCSVGLNQPDLLKYRWHSAGNFYPGNNLTIFLGGELDERDYTCEVTNPVSEETSTFTAKDCNRDAGSAAGRIALIVSLCSIPICLVLLVVLVYTLYRIRRRCRGVEERKEAEQQDERDPCLGSVAEKRAVYEQLSLGHRANDAPRRTVLDQNIKRSKSPSSTSANGHSKYSAGGDEATKNVHPVAEEGFSGDLDHPSGEEEEIEIQMGPTKMRMEGHTASRRD